jgi:hypothetical protein
MSAKPETTFIAAIHRGLNPHGPHAEKNHNPYRGGTADVWYSGDKGDLWVEYKFVQTVTPKSRAVIPDLTQLQIDWLMSRYEEGRNVAVVLGVGKLGGVIYRERGWEIPLSGELFLTKMVSRGEISRWILDQTGRRYVRSSESSGISR